MGKRELSDCEEKLGNWDKFFYLQFLNMKNIIQEKWKNIVQGIPVYPPLKLNNYE